MSFDKLESAKWTIGVEKENAKLLNTIEKALNDSAARGFCEPPGENLEMILMASQEAKEALVAINGEIYQDRRSIIFSEYEFSLKIMIRVLTLGMELYRENIFNALSIEQSEVQAAFRRGEADIKRLNSDTERRQIAIIRDRATAQDQIAILKAQLVVAQQGTLPYESALVAAELHTAEMKLQIIQSIYQIIAAMKVELVAEQRKVVALQDLLAAEQVLLTVKQAMVPFYLEKATAEEKLAAAETANMPIQEALIKLGFARLDLATAGQYVDHILRQAEENVKLANASYIQVEEANRVTRMQNEITLDQHSLVNLTRKLTSLLENMDEQTQNKVEEILASATQITSYQSTTESQEVIQSGTTILP